MNDLTRVVATALEEDLGLAGDLTTLATVPPSAAGTAYLVARAPGVLSGRHAVDETFRQVDEAVKVTWHAADGDAFPARMTLAEFSGPARSILVGERTALNLLGHLSGIATRTASFVRLVEGTRARIADTRKTTPGLRALEKRAVTHGGGINHRFGLHDAILVKDNHIGLGGGLDKVLDRLASRTGHLVRVEIEVDTLDQLEQLLAFDADRCERGLPPVVHAVLLDNMSPAQAHDGVERVRRHTAPLVVEVSGGVDETSVRALALAGPDIISVGALTHSVTVLDVGLDLTGMS